jgi:pimeloyl-ACP methyl ester carboxylesterase
MTKQTTLVGQLRGATRLAIEATRHVTDVVEAMHHTIVAGPELLGRPLDTAAKLLTAPAYGTARGVTALVALGLDRTLRQLETVLNRPGGESGPLLAALNGVVGDHLAATGNPLAIEMRLLSRGAPLELTPEALREAFPAGNQLLVMLHGSSVDETAWQRKGHNHGDALAAERGLLPLYLRYNSGLHISQNGRAFAAMLEHLVAAWPREVEGVVFLTHSMGGLVARSACLIAEAENQQWRRRLRAMVTLGTPHHGAPLERGGNRFETLLGVSRYSAPLAKLSRLRSAGVTDLRYGNVLDDHWQGKDRFARAGDPRVAISLPSGVACFAIAGTLATVLSKRLPMDGMVPVDSALGRHRTPGLTLGFEDSHQWTALGTNHLDLLSSPPVYAKLLEWLPATMFAAPSSRSGPDSLL